MSSIAGLLPNPSPRPPVDSHNAQSESETPSYSSQQAGDGFDAVLSGLTPVAASSEAKGLGADPGDNIAGSAPATPAKIMAQAASLGAQSATNGANASTAESPPIGWQSFVSRSASLVNSNTVTNVSQNSVTAVAGTNAGTLAGGSSLGEAVRSVATLGRIGGPQLAASGAVNGATPTVDTQNAAAIAAAANAGMSADTVTLPGSDEADAPTNAQSAKTTSNATSQNGTASANVVAAMALMAQTIVPVAQGAAHSAPKSSRNVAATQPSSASKTSTKSSQSNDTINDSASGALVQSMAQAVMPMAALSNNTLATGSATHDNPTSLAAPQLRGIASGTVALGLDANNNALSASATAASDLVNVGTSSDMTVTVLSQATHFAPVARLSPTQQIAEAVVGALPNPSQLVLGSIGGQSGSAADATAVSAGAASSTDSTSLTQSALGPAKTLNLQLEPPSLGTVTINLNLSSGGLDVQLAASQSATMNLIEKDKDSLSNQLRNSGYAVVGVVVTAGGHAGPNVASTGTGTQSQNGQAFAQGGGQAMSQGGSSNGNGSAQNGFGRAPQPPLGETASILPTPSADSAPSGDLYI